MTSPIISVIIVTYNRPEKLRVAIQSIFDQTLTEWELIVLDYTENQSVNASVREWATKDLRVQWVAHDKNINIISCCWNEGLDISKGKYWCTLDDDNTKYPAFLKNMTNYLEEHPEKYSVVCPMDNINNGVKEEILFWKPTNFADLMNFNKMDSGQIVHRKSLLEKIGYFDERLRSYDDWDYNLRIFSINNKSGNALGWLDGPPLCGYAKHPQQRTNDPAVRKTWEQTVPFIRKKDLNEKSRIKIISAKIKTSESQQQCIDDLFNVIQSIPLIEIVNDNADIIILNGILFRFTEHEILTAIAENSKAQTAAFIIEDRQAACINTIYSSYVDWMITADEKAYEYYRNNVEEKKKKQIIYWNAEKYKNEKNNTIFKIINCIRSSRFNIKLT